MKRRLRVMGGIFLSIERGNKRSFEGFAERETGIAGRNETIQGKFHPICECILLIFKDSQSNN